MRAWSQGMSCSSVRRSLRVYLGQAVCSLRSNELLQASILKSTFISGSCMAVGHGAVIVAPSSSMISISVKLYTGMSSPLRLLICCRGLDDMFPAVQGSMHMVMWVYLRDGGICQACINRCIIANDALALLQIRQLRKLSLRYCDKSMWTIWLVVLMSKGVCMSPRLVSCTGHDVILEAFKYICFISGFL
jgi:hypothetical protein